MIFFLRPPSRHLFIFYFQIKPYINDSTCLTAVKNTKTTVLRHCSTKKDVDSLQVSQVSFYLWCHSPTQQFSHVFKFCRIFCSAGIKTLKLKALIFVWMCQLVANTQLSVYITVIMIKEINFGGIIRQVIRYTNINETIAVSEVTNFCSSSFFSPQNTKQIIFGHNNHRCLDHDPVTSKVYVTECEDGSESQMWNVEHIDEAALAKWDETEPEVD